MQSNRKRTDKNRGVRIKRYENKRKYLYIFALICLGILVSMGASSASYVGVADYEITNEYVHAVGAYPSASCDGGYYPHYDCPYFENYCPGCGCHGTISFEQGVAGNPEGMFYCTNCDMDFSCISGIDHGYMGIYLYTYVKPEVEEITVPEPPKNKTVEVKMMGTTHTLTLEPTVAQAIGI